MRHTKAVGMRTADRAALLHAFWGATMRLALRAGQVMFDPYARALTAVQLPEGTNVAPPKAGGGSPQNGAGAPGNPPATMGCLSVLADTFDWGASQR